MREPRPGLRVINNRNDVSKISLVVPAGDELEVSEDVLLQIAAQNQDFVEVGSDAADRALPYPPPPEEDPVDVPVGEAKPAVKRPAKRAGKRA